MKRLTLADGCRGKMVVLGDDGIGERNEESESKKVGVGMKSLYTFHYIRDTLKETNAASAPGLVGLCKGSGS